MSVESVTELGVARLGMTPSPIYGDRILEGTPVARNSVLSSSADGAASTVMWDCTAGRFNWFYDGDETIYVIEGSVIIKDGAGVARRLSAGDTIFFPAGSRAEWHVENYIRKIAFCRTPLPRPLVFAKRGLKFLKPDGRGRGLGRGYRRLLLHIVRAPFMDSISASGKAVRRMRRPSR